MLPPLPCLIGLLVGLACDWLWPWPIVRYMFALPLGILLIGVMIVISIGTNKAFKLHATPPDPSEETSAIIDTGPFKYSRNPVYLAVVILQVALGFVFNNTWIVLFAIPAMIMIHYVVVLGEEAYLEAKFGDKYLRYKSQVRRWI